MRFSCGGPKQASKIKNKIFDEYINVSKSVSNEKFGSAFRFGWSCVWSI